MSDRGQEILLKLWKKWELDVCKKELQAWKDYLRVNNVMKWELRELCDKMRNENKMVEQKISDIKSGKSINRRSAPPGSFVFSSAKDMFI